MPKKSLTRIERRVSPQKTNLLVLREQRFFRRFEKHLADYKNSAVSSLQSVDSPILKAHESGRVCFCYSLRREDEDIPECQYLCNEFKSINLNNISRIALLIYLKDLKENVQKKREQMSKMYSSEETASEIELTLQLYHLGGFIKGCEFFIQIIQQFNQQIRDYNARNNK